jgi:hydroxymethylpyrimidine pyrophosphatase-like HAD family hydrolase
MKNIVLFDMDGTLTEPRKNLDNSMLDAISLLAQYADIGIVSGSPMEYIRRAVWIDF